ATLKLADLGPHHSRHKIHVIRIVSLYYHVARLDQRPVFPADLDGRRCLIYRLGPEHLNGNNTGSDNCQDCDQQLPFLDSSPHPAHIDLFVVLFIPITVAIGVRFRVAACRGRCISVPADGLLPRGLDLLEIKSFFWHCDSLRKYNGSRFAEHPAAAMEPARVLRYSARTL